MNGPAVTAIETAVYVIPTDTPEADGTLAWDKTTMVLVTVRAGGEQGLGWSYASAAAQTVNCPRSASAGSRSRSRRRIWRAWPRSDDRCGPM